MRIEGNCAKTSKGVPNLMVNLAEHFRVVCLGGSAGGLEAYREILLHLSAVSGMAFIVAPHRALEHADLLLPLLAATTAMPVIEVRQDMRLEPNRVFIMPPGKDMTTTINRGKFNLERMPGVRGLPTTITVLLLSICEAYGSRAVAVILSGMDQDGSAALKAIKAAGGVTFAQSNPAFASMPRHAVATGHIDFVLQPAEIAETLLELTAMTGF
jgi:two-component system CheB/CheR fusion protein